MNVIEAGLEINKLKIEKWKEKEIEKINNNPNEYYNFIQSITNQGHNSG